jgi:8-oxo-dGTP pyrophosphatase MutT (NUDIX family)
MRKAFHYSRYPGTHLAGGTILCNNEWLQLKDKDGYIYSHEIRCNGSIVVVLPYRKISEKMYAFLLRDEVTPCWSDGPTRSAITGGIESLDPGEDAVRELKEEAGYSIIRSQLEFLGKCRASKSADTYYFLYAVDLTELVPEEALGDGSKNDQAPSVWVSGHELSELEDAQAITAYCKACIKLGIY